MKRFKIQRQRLVTEEIDLVLDIPAHMKVTVDDEHLYVKRFAEHSRLTWQETHSGGPAITRIMPLGDAEPTLLAPPEAEAISVSTGGTKKTSWWKKRQAD